MMMKKLTTFLLSPVFAILACFFAGFNHKETKENNRNNGFAVVELFTAEGCSSCPPADEAIIQLAKDYPDHVYILGYHVDYWNSTGWTDEFGSALYSARQQEYSKKLHQRGIYTPQVIVNGVKQFVGSNTKLLRSSVQESLDTTFSVSLKLNVEKGNGDSINVRYETGRAKGTVLQIALVQLKAETVVKRGENEGRTLHHINIVRELKTLPAGKSSSGTLAFAIPKGLSAKDIKIIAFLQNSDGWQIAGAASASLK